MSSSDEVHVVIGGYHYYLDTDDLLQHPNSYFAHMLKDEWVKDKTAMITLNRNGKVFRYISYYLFSGYMDPNRKPILDLDMLLTLRTEADFYGLPELVRMCDDRLKYSIDDLISNQHKVGLSCDCFRANDEKATDALVAAMNIFRPPTIATSRLETYTSDSLDSYYKNVSALLKCARKSNHGKDSACAFAHNCVEVAEFGFNLGSCKHTVFSNWPLWTLKGDVEVSIEEEKVYIYKTGGYCNGHVPNPLSERGHGTYLYIFNSEHTGGRITAKVNGEEVSIEKPGECMALLPGCSYSVETVTSGHLVLFEYDVELSCDAFSDDEGDDQSEAYTCRNDTAGHKDTIDCEEDNNRESDSESENEDEEVSEEDSSDDSGSDSGSEMDADNESESASEEVEENSAEEDGDGSSEESGSEMESDVSDSVESFDRNAAGAASVEKPLVWQVRDSFSTEITPERSAALTQAIDTALETYAGVVICLSTYYPAGHSTNNNRRCETDPALLRRFDAKLHTHLSTIYEVTVVSVAVEVDEESGHSTARVLDLPKDADMRLKVVAPMQSVSFDYDRSETMLLTGLLCIAQE
eukprot:gene9740-11446_t